MASGHVNRTNRPNTWLHRPTCKREEKPCQLGAVHTWHKADTAGWLSACPLLGNSGHRPPGLALPGARQPDTARRTLKISNRIQAVGRITGRVASLQGGQACVARKRAITQ